MKIKIVQMKSINGKFKQNVQFMLEEIKSAIGFADVIVFPELCVSGSLIMDYFKRTAVINELLDYNLELIDSSHDIMVIWGNVDLQRGQLFDTAFVAYQGELVFKSHKKFNSTSNLRFKKQYFVHPHHDEVKTFEAFGHRCAIAINNDIMVHDFDEAEIIFHLNSHYYRKQDNLDFKIQFISELNKTVVSVNAVGIVNAYKYFGILDGQSLVYKDDQIYVLNSRFEQESQIIDLNQFKSNLNGERIELIDVLLFAIKQIDQEIFSFKPKWIVGLSGGLDSSVVAALLTMALGHDRVVGLNLATQFNSVTTQDNARDLAKRLGIDYIPLNIDELVDSTNHVFDQQGYQIEGLAHENVQARLRGHMLMTYASVVNGVVSNNTNKIENALGYGTLYGDTIGALGILADCTKMDVIKLAKRINERGNTDIIPNNLIPVMTQEGLMWDFAPSAELKENQVDPMKWGYHDYLIERILTEPNAMHNILTDYQNGTMMDSEIGKYLKQYQLQDGKAFIDDLTWLVSSISKNSFKRLQGVPFIVVSESAMGLDTCENQIDLIVAQEIQELMRQIRGD